MAPLVDEVALVPELVEAPLLPVAPELLPPEEPPGEVDPPELCPEVPPLEPAPADVPPEVPPDVAEAVEVEVPLLLPAPEEDPVPSPASGAGHMQSPKPPSARQRIAPLTPPPQSQG